jgi:hypothetical protein
LLLDITRETKIFLKPKKLKGSGQDGASNKSNNASVTTSQSGKPAYNNEISDYAFPTKDKAIDEIEEEKLIEKAIQKNYIWSQEKEGVFKNHRLDSKQRMYNEIKSSSFTEVAFSPLVQASQIDEKSKLQRDTKLAKYINGDALSPEEYQLLANTSRSLNSHVDKRMLQTTINHLDLSVVEAVRSFIIFLMSLRWR